MRPARSARFRAARFAGLLLLAAMAPGCSGAPAWAAPAAPVARYPYADHVEGASLRFGIPEVWIWRVMHAESRGKASAVSHAGAMGLMQIMPPTWAMLTARHNLGKDPFDPRANILAGAAYLRAMWDRYRDVRLMLAAYNAGPGRADAYAAGRRGLPAETIAYVAAIALAIGASGDASLAPAPPPASPGWRSAALFAAQNGGASRGAAAPQPQAGDDTAAPRLRGERSTSSLFVPLSGRE